MAIQYKDCPPSLQAAIDAALARDLLNNPPEQDPLYAILTYVVGVPTYSPASPDKRKMQKIVNFLNLRNGATAYRTKIGAPPAILVQATNQTHPDTLP